MWIFWYALSLIFTIVIWFLIIRLILKWRLDQFYLWEMIVYSFMVWVVVIPFLLFLVNLIGIKYNILNISLTVLLLFGILLFFNLRNKEKLRFSKTELIKNLKWNKKIINVLLWIWCIRVLVKLIFWFISIVNVPTYQDDTFWNRNFRAKVFYERENLVLDQSDEDFLWQWYKQYPLTPSLYKTYLMKMTGYRSDWLANLPSFLFYISIIVLIFYCTFRYTKKISWGMLSSIILCWVPLYYIHWTNPYFDVFQSLYFFASLYICYLFVDKKIWIWLPVLFVWMLWYTKSEWLLIYTTTVLWTYFLWHLINKEKIFKKENILNFIKITWWAVLINLPFIIFKIVKWLWFANWNESIWDVTFETHPEIFKAIFDVLFNGWCYNILFFALVIWVLIYLFNKKIKFDRREILWFLLWFFIALSIIIFIYFVTFNYKEVTTQTWVNRSFMQLIPIIVYAVVLMFYNIYNEE